jgi:hypothetical protein
MPQAVRMGQPIRGNSPFGADVAFIEKSVRVAFDLDDLVILHADQEAAAPVVHPGAVGFMPFYIR